MCRHSCSLYNFLIFLSLVAWADVLVNVTLVPVLPVMCSYLSVVDFTTPLSRSPVALRLEAIQLRRPTAGTYVGKTLLVENHIILAR